MAPRVIVDLPLSTTLSPVAWALLAAGALLAGAWTVRGVRRRARMRRYGAILAALRAGEELEPDERPPRLRNRARVERALGRYVRAAGIQSAPEPVVLRYVVTPDGRPAEPAVTSSSGNPAFDAAVLQALRRARFEPAYVYGLPVRVWVEQPFTVRPPG